MSLRVDPVMPGFVAKLSDLDLRKVTTTESEAVVTALDQYGVLIFPGQHLSAEDLVEFGSHFGPLDAEKNRKILDKIQQRLASDVVHDISNVAKSGEVAGVNDPQSIMNVTNMLWHTDGAYQNRPARYSILAAATAVGRGGQTEFADSRAAYDRLDDQTRSLVEEMIGIFYSLHTRMQLGVVDREEMYDVYPPVRWPLVRRHPGSGRKVLYIDSKLCAIEGLSIPEARALAGELIEHATRPDNVYSHSWTAGDVVMWDNRATLHRGRRFDRTERREMRRVQVLDDVESLGNVDRREVLPKASSAPRAAMA